MSTLMGHPDFSLRQIAKNNLPALYGTAFILLALLVLSFGSMLPWLGYGFDEWHFVYYSTRGPQGLAELFHYDGHPQAAWSYIQSFKILGYTPFYWHLYSLFWRGLAVLSFWLCLQRIWPTHYRQNFFAAALFAVHPIFTLQIFPISFFEVWVGYTLLFLSFYFTIRSIQTPEKQRIFTIIAISLAIGHVFTREYAWFVELMRPVFIWLALARRNGSQKGFVQIARIWFPFFVIFISSLIWRGFFYTPLRKSFQVPDHLFENPLNTLLAGMVNLLPDISIVLFTSWYETFRSEYLYLVSPFNIILLILTIFVVTALGVYVRKIDHPSPNDEQWALQAFFLGLPSILFGILPFYIASYSLHLTDPPHNSRLALGMLPGAALISAAIVEKALSKQNLKVWITAILVGLSVSWHIRYTNDFRKVWLYQSSFLQQLTWRVPGIEDDTAIFAWQPTLPDIDNSNAGIALYGDFPLSMAINSIYKPNPTPAESRLSYWYYPLAGQAVDITRNTSLHSEHATTYFDGNTSNALFFYYDPENNRCLHLVDRDDQYYKQYPAVIRAMSAHATAERVSATTVQNVLLRDGILGNDQNTWCFFYQKADLAQQNKHWDEIPLLWEQASSSKLKTAFGTEYLPFIRGFAHLGEWQKAGEITSAANKLSKAMDSILCPLWADLDQSTPASAEKDKAVRQVRDTLGCVDQ